MCVELYRIIADFQYTALDLAVSKIRDTGTYLKFMDMFDYECPVSTISTLNYFSYYITILTFKRWKFKLFKIHVAVDLFYYLK